MNRCCAVLVLLLLSHTTSIAADQPPSTLSPGSLVRIRAPKTIHIPGVFTATDGQTEWHAKRSPGDASLLIAGNDDWPEPIASPRPGETMQGWVVSTDASGIVLQLGTGRTSTVRVPSEAIEKLDVSQGRTSRGKKALILGGVGLVAGLAVTGAISATCEGWDCLGAAGALYILTPVLCVGGVITGAAGPPGQHWKAVPWDKPRVSLSAAGRHGVGVQMSIPF